jgi:BirA family biotin operon repressor/biotin-[acetyl-CoA-carboxylase] ligase
MTKGARADDELSEVAVQAALTTAWLGRNYQYLDSVGSTNDHLKAMSVDADVPEGAVLLADYQTAGRGRLDRRWDAPPGAALLFSVLLRPGWPAERALWLVMLAGLAAVEVIEAVVGLPARLKWPNDVVLDQDGQWRKVGGLLVDTALDSHGRLVSAILGLGLNVNIPATALPPAAMLPTSLMIAAGRSVARRPLLVALLERLEQRYEAARRGESPLSAWKAQLITLGQAVTVSSAGAGAAGAGESLAGTAEDTDEWGRLLVRDETGRLHTVAAGDVTLRSR